MKTIRLIAVLLPLVLFSCTTGHYVDVEVFNHDGTKDTLALRLEKSSGCLHLQIPAEKLSGVDSLLVTPDFAQAEAGDDGYFVLPNGMLCKFPESEDRSYSLSWQQMPISGSFTPNGNYMAIVKGLRMENKLIDKLASGHYSLSYLFSFKDVEPYEDIVIDWYELKGKDADYSGMGRLYRKYQLDRGEVKPLKERAADNELLS